mgnify:CR=1 FL=1
MFAGYQAEGTLGRILQDGAQTVKIFGEEIDVRAHIETMDGISGHADRDGLISWISAFEKSRIMFLWFTEARNPAYPSRMC